MNLLLVSLFALSGPNALPARVEGEPCHPTRLMAQIASPIAEQSIVSAGARIARRFPEIGYVVVETMPGMLEATRLKLSHAPGIIRVDLDRAARPAYDPNDPLWPQMWHFRTIQANTAWDLSRGSPIPVAVIDTGVEVTHPDLAANIWTNTREIPNNGIDDDNNGYIDDIHGWDFAYNDNNPDDQYGHGTACSGLVGAVQDNSIGVTGVAPNARIMALKASTDAGYFYDSNNVGAYLYAANNGARVLSMSFFSDRVSNSERVAIDYCWSHGVLPVAAAANDATVYPYYPAAYENVLSVAATDSNNNKAGFSDFGTWVDVAAPGVSLTTTAIGAGYTDGFGGTSGACPHVAGLATLLFGANTSATNAQVRTAIEDSATLLDQPPFGEFSNYGLVNARAAMQGILGGTIPGKAPTVRYVTPVTHEGAPASTAVIQTCRIYGRGFQVPRRLSVTLNGANVHIIRRSRDWLDVALPRGSGNLTVRVDGSSVSVIPIPNDARTVYSCIEAVNKDGGWSNGTFGQLLQADGQEMSCSPSNEGHYHVEATFRRVLPASAMTLSITRRYPSSNSGQENIYLYDWSSASYPYGQFVLIGATTTSQAASTSNFPVPNAPRFVDPEGTMYLLIETQDSPGSQMKIDRLFIAK